MDRNKRILLIIAVAVVIVALVFFFFQNQTGGGWLGAGTQSVTVTITKESPTIQVGDIQYKFAEVPLVYELPTFLAGSTSGSIYTIPSGTKTCTPDYRARGKQYSEYSQPSTSFGQIVGRIGKHELVVTYDYYAVGFIECGKTCPAGSCSLHSGNAAYGEIHVTGATLDGQTLAVGTGNTLTSYGTQLATSESTRGLLAPKLMWVAVGDFMVKFEVISTTPTSEWYHHDYIKYYDSGYKFSMFVYAPVAYFVEPTCGDNNCDLGETCKTCANDCGICEPSCGDGECKSTSDYTELSSTCPQDCPPTQPYCGDSVCNGQETCQNCAQDCGSCILFYCGDGACNGDETCNTCIQDCGACPGVCANGLCDGGEDCSSCTQDCGVCAPRCGDAACNGQEDCRSCSMDCGACPPSCGDGTCNANENCKICHADCGVCPAYCGDGNCSAIENSDNCVADCGYRTPYCGDHVCSDTENCASCSRDCGVCLIAPIKQVYYEPPAVDSAKVALYNSLLSRKGDISNPLSSIEEDLMDDLEAYLKAYQAMQSWVNKNAQSCDSNGGTTYGLLAYYCDGFATEMFYRNSKAPEFDTQMGCCIAGFGVKSLANPVTWQYASTAPDFLRTKVDINKFDTNYTLGFSKQCSDLTAGKGFIYDPLFWTCSEAAGSLDSTTGYGCCKTTAQVIVNPPAVDPVTEPLPSDPRGELPSGGGGGMPEDWTLYLLVGGVAVVILIGFLYYRRKR